MAHHRHVLIDRLLYLLIFLEVYEVVCNEPIASFHFNALNGFDYFNLTSVFRLEDIDFASVVDLQKIQNTCSSLAEYLYNSLTWFINLEQHFCLSVNQTHPVSQCTLEMAINHSFGSPGPCQNSSVCSIADQENVSLGAYTENPLSPLAPPDSNRGFQAFFTNGSHHSTASGTSCLLQTSIVFLCNVSAIWTTPGPPESRKKALDPRFISYNNRTCQLNLIFDFAGACKKEPLLEKHLSTGTILIVIFVVSVILYFALGSMINLARGHVGSDVIPHARFWTMLPVYISDGFQFVFCCGRMSVTSTYEQI